jgi:hypothetical protein
MHRDIISDNILIIILSINSYFIQKLCYLTGAEEVTDLSLSVSDLIRG